MLQKTAIQPLETLNQASRVQGGTIPEQTVQHGAPLCARSPLIINPPLYLRYVLASALYAGFAKQIQIIADTI